MGRGHARGEGKNRPEKTLTIPHDWFLAVHHSPEQAGHTRSPGHKRQHATLRQPDGPQAQPRVWPTGRAHWTSARCQKTHTEAGQQHKPATPRRRTASQHTRRAAAPGQEQAQHHTPSPRVAAEACRSPIAPRCHQCKPHQCVQAQQAAATHTQPGTDANAPGSPPSASRPLRAAFRMLHAVAM